MINGKSLFLDIGTDSIKAVEIAKTTDKMMLTNATIISDARRYLSEYGVENMSGLVNCITDELENSGFTAKRVYIASSSLRIESSLEITDDSGKAQPSKADEASNTSIVSKQVYGSIVYDNKVCTSTVISIGDSYVLRSLAESFDAKGYQVVSIEDSITTVMNLAKLTKYTFDFPGKVIISFGNTTKYICYNKDCPVSINEYGARISDMIAQIADALKMTYQEINTLFFKYGLIMSEEAIRELMSRGIDPNGYFDAIRGCCLSYLEQLKEEVDAECETKGLGRCYIIVTGGYADIPGLYDMLEHEFCDEYKILLRNAIPHMYENEYFVIQNKTGARDIGAVYGTCTGFLLKDMFRQSINLLPKYQKLDSSTNMTSALKGFAFMSAAAFVVAVIMLVITCFSYMSTPIVPISGDDLNYQRETLLHKEEQLDKQLEAVGSLKTTGASLVGLCNRYSGGMLTVISIDSTDVLTSGEDETQGTTGSTDGSASSDAQDANVQPVEDMTTVVNNDYTIRGFAADPSYVTAFFENICANGYKGKATMNDGIRKVTLPSMVEMYIFEIIVKG